jgi:hypothetical protein
LAALELAQERFRQACARCQRVEREPLLKAKGSDTLPDLRPNRLGKVFLLSPLRSLSSRHTG